MKKLLPVLFAVLSGIVCAFLLFKNVEGSMTSGDDTNAIAVQIGVFTKKENAVSMSESIGGIVLLDGELYRVYYSILRSNENINYITEYLKEKGISYYLKKINLNDNAVSEIDKIDGILNKSSKDNRILLNQELLKKVKDVI